MADISGKGKNLRGGEFYGDVPDKRNISSAIISEVVHRGEKDLPRHFHELAFFTLALGGCYSEVYGRKSFTYYPLTVWWHPPEISHKDRVGREGGRFLCVEIRPAGISALEQYANVPADFYEKSTPLVWLACRLYNEFKNWQTCSELVAEGLTLEMLAHSARKKDRVEKHRPKWLDRVVEKLDDEFLETHSSRELAAEARVHPVHLAAVFRRFQNQTIGEYVQTLRIRYASGLLLDKEIPLCEIALSAGFSDQSHFTRIFKRLTGTTPAGFRRTICG